MRLALSVMFTIVLCFMVKCVVMKQKTFKRGKVLSKMKVSSHHRTGETVWENKRRYIKFMILSLLSLQLPCRGFVYEIYKDCDFFSITKCSLPFSAYVHSLANPDFFRISRSQWKGSIFYILN